MRNKRVLYNLIFGFGGQIVLLLLGIIIPRLVIISFGSEVNGLLSTVQQIFTYIALMEAGIGSAELNELFKPISDRDNDKTNEIVSSAQRSFLRTSIIYICCVIALAAILPFTLKTNVNKITIALVTFFQGLSGVLVYSTIVAYKQLLIADGKNYVITNVNLLVHILSSALKIILIKIGMSVIVIQIAYFFITLLNIIVLRLYCKREYPWLIVKPSSNLKPLSQRKAFIIHELSITVFSSTDVVVLSTFCGLSVASVYGVYGLIFFSLSSLISTVGESLVYVLGTHYQGSREDYLCVHDVFDGYFNALVFSLMSVAYILAIPFITLYTSGVTDINYIDPNLPILFCLIQFLTCCRTAASRLISFSGHANDTKWRSVAESSINLIASLILVNVFNKINPAYGIYGVLLGTIIASLYRANDMMIYANVKILKRKPTKTYLITISNLVLFFILMSVKNQVSINILSYGTFVLFGGALTICSFIIYFALATLLNIREIRKLLARRIKM